MDTIDKNLPTITPNAVSLSVSTGARPGELIPDLTALLTAMATRMGSADDLRTRLRIYEQDLRPLPVDVTRKVIADFRQGLLGDGRFAPTAAEIAIEVRRVAAARNAVAKARADQAALDAETLTARQRVAARRDEDWREKAAAEVEQFKRQAAVASGAVVRGDDWATEKRAPTKVENFSDRLCAQLAGEAPIGVGKFGAMPLAQLKAEE